MSTGSRPASVCGAPGRRGAILLASLLVACATARPVPGSDAVERGLASYYADSLAGRRTASGEVYRPAAATCAHRELPFGTRVTIVVVASGRSATCRVNDRGPFVKGRIVDVSRSVAERLGMIEQGVVEVEVRASAR